MTDPSDTGIDDRQDVDYLVNDHVESIWPVALLGFGAAGGGHKINKKLLKNVGPIRHCEPPHAACNGLF